jgi:hypothetical protein
MKFKTTIAALGTAAMLAIPAATMAAPVEPGADGCVRKDNQNYQAKIANAVR